MHTNKTVTLISTLLLRVGVILFVFSQLFEIAKNIQSGNAFWRYFLHVLLLLIFVGLSVIILVLDKAKFEVFGFFLVLTGSIFSFLSILFAEGIRPELSIHFLLVAVSIYFILKSRHSYRKRATNVFE